MLKFTELPTGEEIFNYLIELKKDEWSDDEFFSWRDVDSSDPSARVKSVTFELTDGVDVVVYDCGATLFTQIWAADNDDLRCFESVDLCDESSHGDGRYEFRHSDINAACEFLSVWYHCAVTGELPQWYADVLRYAEFDDR